MLLGQQAAKDPDLFDIPVRLVSHQSRVASQLDSNMSALPTHPTRQLSRLSASQLNFLGNFDESLSASDHLQASAIRSKTVEAEPGPEQFVNGSHSFSSRLADAQTELATARRLSPHHLGAFEAVVSGLKGFPTSLPSESLADFSVASQPVPGAVSSLSNSLLSDNGDMRTLLAQLTKATLPSS